MNNLLPVLLVITAFGPYLTSSIRLEHLILYPTALLALVIAVTGRLATPARLPALIITFFSAIIAVSIFNTLLAYPVPFTRIFSQLDNWFQPIAIALIAIIYGQRLHRAFPWILGMLSVNALLQLYQAFTGNVTINAPFVIGDEVRGSVADRAAELGRYGGVFAQPFEGGVAFGVGILLWFYMTRQGKGGFWMWLALPLILVGGLLTVSKVFILVAIPLFLVYALWERFSVNWITTWSGLRRTALAAILIFGGGYALLNVWDGAGYALRLLAPDDRKGGTLLEFYTAGRLGGETDLNKDLQIAKQEEPVFGYGFRSFETVDNGYFDAYAQAGIAGLVFIIAVLLVIFMRGWNVRSEPEGRLLMLLAVFMALASVGAPALTTNRGNILLWVVVFGASALAVQAPRTQDDRATEFDWDEIPSQI